MASPGVALADAAPVESGPGELDALEPVLRQLRAGDLEAFEELMRLTEGRVLAVAWRMLGDRDQAQDAAQEVYLRVHRSLAGFRAGENFPAWLYRITVNVCCDLIRKRGPRMAAEAVLETAAQAWGGGESAEDALLRAERRTLVRRALAALTPAERSALVLRDLEGLSTEETARCLGVRPVTVRSQISAARAKVQAFCANCLGGRS